MKQNNKILFFINALEHGGAARVTVTLCNELITKGYTVFVMANTQFQKVNYKVKSEVILIPLFTDEYFKYPRIIRRLFFYYSIRRKIIKSKPDIIIGVMPDNFLLVKICSLGLSIPVIASDHTSFNNKNVGRRENFVRFFLYNFADAVTILTQADYDLLGKRLPKKIVMPNPLEYDIFNGQNSRKKNILAAGRLDAWWVKGFDTLIETWACIAKIYPDWILEIAGAGSNESLLKLTNLAKKLEIENQVSFLGHSLDLDKLMQESSIFVLSSRYEGFGLVLVEAMSQGCACIAFELDGRINEIISSPEGGIIINDKNNEALKNGLINLIENESLRNSISVNAKQEAARFSKKVIADRWEMLFNHVKKNI